MKVNLVLMALMAFCSIGFSQNKPTIDWVSIPTGTFTMGSPLSEDYRESDETQHEVTLSAFKIGKYEVTFAQYDAFCSATGRTKPNDWGWGRGNRPVINVSWDDANAFAAWMGCRLPTEAQWEYACRAGTTTAYSVGNVLYPEQANYHDVGANKTLPVGAYAPNAWGLYDMHGNVWEWCSDLYSDYLTETQTNPKGPSTGGPHSIRGGSWYHYSRYLRSACRDHAFPDYRYNTLGFRVVSSAK